MDAVVYQIFPDRFASSGTKPLPEWAVAAGWDDEVIHIGRDTPRQFFGGDLDGIAGASRPCPGVWAPTPSI